MRRPWSIRNASMFDENIVHNIDWMQNFVSRSVKIQLIDRKNGKCSICWIMANVVWGKRGKRAAHVKNGGDISNGPRFFPWVEIDVQIAFGSVDDSPIIFQYHLNLYTYLISSPACHAHCFEWHHHSIARRTYIFSNIIVIVFSRCYSCVIYVVIWAAGKFIDTTAMDVINQYQQHNGHCIYINSMVDRRWMQGYCIRSEIFACYLVTASSNRKQIQFTHRFAVDVQRWNAIISRQKIATLIRTIR